LVALDSLLATLQDLTAIQAYSGWRNAGSQGESEALSYVEQRLKDLAFLAKNGLKIERQSFPVFLAIEERDSRLFLTLGGREVEAPASGLRGARFDSRLALFFDSDGALNDAQPDPLIASGPPLLIRAAELLYQLTPEAVQGRVLFVDAGILDLATTDNAIDQALQLADLIAMRPAGVALVSKYSNTPGESRGSFIGDGGVFQYIEVQPRVPILHLRLEDLAASGIASWEALEQAFQEQAPSVRLVWDADVFSPGRSGNLVARIPGADSSQAVILGAHIDSPNGPGAFDDGSGVAALLEVARVLDAARLQPPVDLYLVWFGSHEIGVYGSAHFVATHQDLLDRTLAMLQLDCLGYPMEKHQLDLNLYSWSYSQFTGDSQAPEARPLWGEFLAEAVASQGIAVYPYIEHSPVSDNSNFDAFDVPSADLIYLNQSYFLKGSAYLHYAAHLHDPYETVDLARQVGDVLQDMARTALAAALQTVWEQPDLRPAPAPTRRALFVASHTQPPGVGPSMLTELGLALAWQGFDVDLLPSGQPVSAAELKDAALVLLLPTLDYLGPPGESWTADELQAMQSYVEDGGLLVVSNSFYNLAMNRLLTESNEDSRALNDWLKPYGAAFALGSIQASLAKARGDHPLTHNAAYLKMIGDNGVPIRLTAGQILAQADGRTVLALLDSGSAGGQVLLVADLTLLQDMGRGGKNLTLLQNLARYAWER
jgi:hypothetical protein